MKKVLIIMLAGLMAVFAGLSQAQATILPIVNDSFEANTPEDGGWLTDLAGSKFVRAIESWNYNSQDRIFEGVQRFVEVNYPTGVPDGLNAAYVTSGVNGNFISQVISGSALTTGHLYTLSVYVGKRLDFYGDNQTFGLQLLAGGNVLAEKYDAVNQPGTFELAQLQFLPETGNPFLGLPLEIKLWSFGGQNNFDKVSLTNNNIAPPPGSAVLMLSGLLGMSALGLRLRKN